MENFLPTITPDEILNLTDATWTQMSIIKWTDGLMNYDLTAITVPLLLPKKFQ